MCSVLRVSIALVGLTLPVRTADKSADVLTAAASRCAANCDVIPAVKLAMMIIDAIIHNMPRRRPHKVAGALSDAAAWLIAEPDHHRPVPSPFASFAKCAVSCRSRRPITEPTPTDLAPRM